MNYTKEQTANLQEQTFAYITVEEKDHLLTITLNRPKARNAMSPTMIREYAYAMSYAHHHAHIWAVVFAANGKVWCAGADLKAMRGKEEANDSTVPTPDTPIVMAELFTKIHKPVIAKVHAPVYAGGFLLIGGCTYVVSTEAATFTLPEVKRGLFPFQVMASLMKFMPARQVLDFCIRAKSLSAQEALEAGLVTQLAAPDKLDEAVDALVQEIFANSPSAVRLGLKAFDEMRNISESEQQAYLANMLGQTIMTKDAQEGLKAFAEKRTPAWTGE
ncbi:enoyl-CoA hydratase-related protein [Microscilla marina]|uniref:Enoyl-CoA hydratase/isomerase family protein n=1 Tax=Microscilla marina ATCC 23134 TaxID=313606 RepID=A1ZS59_MICM2|nr:enoyl-CoA hydratase-related protein [Microscilla marina]EAY26782.1 enoyl-CoA hydratase/isomerase family protein [Microscilla marina ATCC 23134]